MAALAGKRWLWRCGVAALLVTLGLWVAAPPAAAREASATVKGVATDPSGVVIPEARASLTNVNTVVLCTTKINSDSAKAFRNVVLGVYTPEARASGFASQPNVTVFG